MIPNFDAAGSLPPGVHGSEWDEFEARFGASGYRNFLLAGLKRALKALKSAGCETAYVDGSFSTGKEHPNDFDGCWSVTGVDPSRLDPVLLDFSNHRAAQKAKYFGELFPAEVPEGGTGKTWLEFFQTDKDTGDPKGITAIDLRRLP